jgi:hypothetical protein
MRRRLPSPAAARGVAGDDDTVIIEFAVSGGFANLTRRVRIDEARDVELERGGRRARATIDEAELTELVGLLDTSGLFDRDREFPASARAADLQRYEIRYGGATVVAYDTTVPPQLDRAVEVLEALARRPDASDA